MRRLQRGGRLLRVADSDWEDPLDGRDTAERGGRWNPRGSFPVVYLCASLAVARANVFRTLTGLPYGPEDLESERGPVLVEAEVPEDPYVDAVTRRGLESLGLPSTYPRTASGSSRSHAAAVRPSAARPGAPASQGSPASAAPRRCPRAARS